MIDIMLAERFTRKPHGAWTVSEEIEKCTR